MKKIIFILILIFGSTAQCQYYPKKQFEKRLTVPELLEIDKVYESKRAVSYILRKSVQDYFSDKNSKLAKKGALFALTKPKDKSTSVAVNAGLMISLSNIIIKVERDTINQGRKKYINKYTKSTFSPYFQFDKNTLVDKEQSNILTGLGYTHNLINYEKFRRSHGNGEKRFNIPIKILSSFRKDYENDFEAFQSSLIFLPRLFKINEKEELTRANWFGDQEFFDFDVNLGLEFDYRFNSKIESLDGNLFRTFSSAKFQVKPSKRFIASLDWNYRYVLANSTSLDEYDFSLLIFKIEYKPKFATYGSLIDSIEPTIGIIHENGENPTNGFNDQSFWSLSLSLKL